MDPVNTIVGGTSLLLVIVISLIPFILLCVIAYRLKLIINNTFRSSSTPGVSYYAEAKAYEKIGDTKLATKCYHMAYWALSELGYKKFKWFGETVNVKDLEAKIGQTEL